ncbi:MAG: hypothetical protein HPY83_03205 [Anaerolineae bacterium]|nr:hypothetical protein [Anaerolineae bacterium]
MGAEVRTLLWLQWRLTLSLFRSRRAEMLARVGRLLFGLMLLVLSLPAFGFMAVGLGLLLANLSPRAAFELATLANAGILFVWLLLPASYDTSLVERFELSRLFVHPVSFRGLVAGSTLVSLFSLVGFWTALLLAGEVVGLAWHAPGALPLIALAALPLFAVLVFSGRLMEDVYDLVAGDRRLRAVMLTLLSLPFLVPVFGNFLIQLLTQEYGSLRTFLGPLLDLPDLENLGFVEAVEVLLLALRSSRFLFWLPTTWAAAGMAFPAMGRWLARLGSLALALGAAAVLLWAHGSLVLRLMRGAAVRLGGEVVRSQRWNRSWPGPPEFWALFLKDWIYLRRGRASRYTFLAAPIVAVSFGGLAVWLTHGFTDPGSPWRQALPALVGALLAVAANLATSSITSNYFGTVDREGFATLMLSPVDRRYVLVSGNLVALLLTMAQTLLFLAIIAGLARTWTVLGAGTVLALLLNLSTAPLYTLAGIIGAKRQDLEQWNRDAGNLWTLLAWVIGTPPVLLLLVVPYLLGRPALVVTLPVAIIYSAGLYLVTLKPLARLLDRRADRILQAVREPS